MNRMLELQSEGASLMTIARVLSSEGYSPPAGKRWHKLDVAHALSHLETDDSSYTDG